MTRNTEAPIGATIRAPNNFANHGSGQQAVLFHHTASAPTGSRAKACLVPVLSRLFELSPSRTILLGRGVLAVWPRMRRV